MGALPKAGPVAYRSLGVWDQSRGLRFDLAVWYPGGASGNSGVMDGRRFGAGHGRPLPGFYPIILLSHDTAGNRFDSGDLAADLASQGFMVIVPTHDGDNIRDESKVFSFTNMVERPRLLLLALEAVLDNPDLGPLADESRIGLIGVGYGAISVMQLLGAKPDHTLLGTYCPKVERRDIFCSGWAGARMAEAGRERAGLAPERLASQLTPPLTLFAPDLEAAPARPTEAPRPTSPAAALSDKLSALAEVLEEDKSAYAVALDFQGGPQFGTFSGSRFVYIDPPDSSAALQLVAREKTPKSPRSQPTDVRSPKVPRRSPQVRAIRAAALVTPAGGMLFAPEELRNIHVPVALVEAGRDEIYPPAEHGGPYFSGLPIPPETLLLSESDHFSLLAPCDSDKNGEQRCGRLTGRERQKVSDRRDAFLGAFFLSAMGGASPPEPPGPYVVKDPPAPNPPAPARNAAPASGGR